MSFIDHASIDYLSIEKFDLFLVFIKKYFQIIWTKAWGNKS